ncbi:MAG: class II aldolase/adducin family protein [Chloroflexi bacterium]|nr:class II aldolase/adducin family protein [Chloroflexota bacterium]
MGTPSDLTTSREDLVAANHILSNEGILDAYGHVSIRNPERPNRYIMAWSRSPELIELEDLLEFELDGTPVEPTDKVLYIERHIHGAIYEARADVMAVCHNHDTAVLPFSISLDVKLKPVIHGGTVLGGEVPVWNITEEFGATDFLVRNMEQGRSLARTVGGGPVALMRAHGSAVAGGDLLEVVSTCIGMDKNATVQMQAMMMGRYIPISDEELAARASLGRGPTRFRAWEYWKRRIGS